MPDADAVVVYRTWVALERREGHYQAALDRLAAVRDEALGVEEAGWTEVNEGKLYRLMGQPERARDAYEAAVAILEEAVATTPDIALHHAYLARAYAGLGRRAEAIREAERALEMAPVEADASASGAVIYVAEAYTTMGEHETALDLLESLASIPSFMSYGYLRYDPAMDPLRDSPRFQKLLADKQSQLPPA